MKERVVFEANVPVSAMLVYAEGLKVRGRFGDRVMSVPPMFRDKLVELGVGQNEPFAICRAERREGNRRFVNWVVKPDGSAAPAQSVTGMTIRHDQTAMPLRAPRQMATAMVAVIVNPPVHALVQELRKLRYAQHGRRASTQLSPRNNTCPHRFYRSALAAKHCVPWR